VPLLLARRRPVVGSAVPGSAKPAGQTGKPRIKVNGILTTLG